MKKRLYGLLFVAGALVHCAASPPQPQEVRVVVVHEYPDAPSADSEVEVRVDHDAPSSTPDVESDPPPALAEDPTVEKAAAPRGPWDDCTIQRYRTGWVVAECSDSVVHMQAGWSARGSDYLVREQLVDHLNRAHADRTWQQKRKLQLAGKTFEGRFLTTRIADKSVPFGGEEATADSPVRFHSLYARVATPESGKVGLTCTNPGTSFDETTCLRRMSEVVKRGIPGGPVRSRDVITLAGVDVQLDSTCRAPSPAEIYCRNEAWEATSITWFEGPRDEVLRDKKKILDHSKGMSGGDPSLRNDYHTMPCTIGGAPATCESTLFYGVLSTPGSANYFVTRHDADRSWVVRCNLGGKSESLRRCAPFVPPELYARR